MINKLVKKIFIFYLITILFFLVGCKGIQIQNSKLASMQEFSIGEVMVFVAQEKDKYEKAFGKDVWYIKSATGNQYYKDYVLSNIKKYIECLMTLKLYANINNIFILNDDIDSIKSAADEYYNSLNNDDLEYMQCTSEDIYNVYLDYRLIDLAIKEMTKNSNIELSIAETKVIETSYIVLDDYETAEKVLAGVKGRGANFNFYANAYTTEKNKNTRMTISRGDDMSVVFPEVFFLATSEISNILEYQNKFYIFKCISDYKEKESKDRRTEILQLLKNKEFNEEFLEFQSQNRMLLGETYWQTIDLSVDGQFSEKRFFDIYSKYFGD